jgi:hypothetical protein
MKFMQYYGRTWIGPSKRLQKSFSKYDEKIIFATTFDDKNILIVAELVIQNEDGDFFSIGWTILKPFDSESNSKDLKK